MSEFNEEDLTQAESFIMPWGKYRGKKLAAIPNDYLIWLSYNKDDNVAGHADLICRWRRQFNIWLD